MKYYKKSGAKQKYVLLHYLLLEFNLHCCSLYGKINFNHVMLKKPVQAEADKLHLEVYSGPLPVGLRIILHF